MIKNNHKIIIFDNYYIPLHHKTYKIWNLNITMKKVRVGYDTKYRLIFDENDDKITLVLIELSEHYGDH